MSYYVEAYLSYDDYRMGEPSIIFIFKNREHYENLYLEDSFFSSLYEVNKGKVLDVDLVEENSSDDSDSC